MTTSAPKVFPVFARAVAPRTARYLAKTLAGKSFAAKSIVAVLAAMLLGTVSAQALEPVKTPHYKIGIIGAGNVGGTLGTLWAKAGNDVLFASRHPEELKALVEKAGPHAKAGTAAEAAAFGDVVLIAVPYTAFQAVAEANGAALKGKVVMDAANAVPPRDGALVDEVHKVGIGAYSAKLLPGVHLARAFNAINYKSMASESFRKGDPVGIPLASDDPKATEVVSDLVRQAGFVPIVVPLDKADSFGPKRPLGSGVFTVPEWKQKLGLTN